MIYSYSRLNTFNNCAQAFKYKYLEDRKAPDTDPLILGTAVHAVIEEYLKGLVAGQRQTDFDLLEEIRARHVQDIPENLIEEFNNIVERFRDSFILTNPGELHDNNI
jgi:ATP-dependent helicase/DNAse subunit B